MAQVMILLVVIIAVAVWAKPQKPHASITKYSFDPLSAEGYKFSYETDDGSKRAEIGKIIDQGQGEQILAVQGAYSYIGDDGKEYKVQYIADEHGFQPSGDHLPPAADVNKPSLGVDTILLTSLNPGK